ncbi:RE1 [Symbiodinium pilosum]|uniref:RE1 protein n=1 Tax=Symbiodinium pilosum TaxID=2952 RepID=A0A812QZB6_SYMPI|nr:RE1 [Symbiodinium pilosum]
MEHFETVWANWAGYPQEVYVDPGGEFVSDAFAVRMQETGVHVKMSASDSHWQLGRTEIHGSTVKGMLSKMDLEKAIDSSLDFQAALRQVFHAKNTLCRADGYTPQQSVLGISPRLPGSLLSDSNAAPHALADSATTEGERFLERLRLRESARRAFHYVDNSSSFRRALLRRTRPLRQDWEKGDLVLYWKRRGGNLRREHGRWHGPAEIIAIEKQKVVWLSHAGRLIRASPEQLRAASLREWARLPKDSLGHPLEQGRDLKEKLKQAPSFLDLEDEGTPTDEDMLAPLEERSEGGSLPEPEPDSEEATVESTRPNILSVPPDFPLPDLTPQQLENQAASQNIPVPDDNMSDLEFGDTEMQGSEETSDVMFGVVDQCWEIDVTPPETWQLPQTVDEDMIFLASESRKKRVEVRLRDLTVSDQKRFAAAKHKEVNAWLSHGTAPGEIREALGMGPQDDCELKGGAYGRIDAPYLWYQELRKALLDLNFQQCPLDPCLFSLSSRDTTGQSRSHGVIGIHVDDGICGGDSVFHAALEKLRQRFSFGSFEKGSFVFTGIRLHQWDDMSIEMDQTDYIESIDAINVPRDRRKHPDAPVTEAERRLLRQLIGSLQYAAVHTRADVCAKVGELQSAVNQAKVFHLLEANRVLQEAKQHHVSIMVVPIAESELTFCAFSDASFASNTKNHAHQGTVIFSTSASILENNTAVVCPMAWASKKISRVVRSTLGAEAIALSNTVDRLSWIRILWAWLKNDQVAWHRPEEALQSEPTAAAVTDCKSVYDIISRTAPPQCEEHRTTIECLLIRQRMQDNCRLRWVASQAMLADCLTKSMDASRLRECLRTGRYSLFDEDRVLKQRADKRQQLRWVKGEPEEGVPEERGEACLHSSHEKQDFWRLDRARGVIERVHRSPRWERFTPIGVGECPVEFGSIGVERTTIANLSSGKRIISSDIWVGSNAYLRENEAWTGITRFQLNEPSTQGTVSSNTSHKFS